MRSTTSPWPTPVSVARFFFVGGRSGQMLQSRAIFGTCGCVKEASSSVKLCGCTGGVAHPGAPAHCHGAYGAWRPTPLPAPPAPTPAPRAKRAQAGQGRLHHPQAREDPQPRPRARSSRGQGQGSPHRLRCAAAGGMPGAPLGVGGSRPGAGGVGCSVAAVAQRRSARQQGCSCEMVHGAAGSLERRRLAAAGLVGAAV